MRGFFWFSFAMISSPMIENTLSDQPRMSVWPVSITFERPLRSSSSRDSRPDVIVPMRMDTMKMPAIVTTSMGKRSPQPSSPERLPASSVRIRLCQAPSVKSRWLFGSDGSTPMPSANSTMAVMITTAAETSASHPISAMGPRESVFSKR